MTELARIRTVKRAAFLSIYLAAILSKLLLLLAGVVDLETKTSRPIFQRQQKHFEKGAKGPEVAKLDVLKIG